MKKPTIAEYADGLRQLADFIEANADTLPNPGYLDDVNVWHPDNAAEVAAIVAAADTNGITHDRDDDGRVSNLALVFGRIEATALIGKDETA